MDVRRRVLVALLLAAAGAAHAGSVAPSLRDALASAGPDDLIPVVALMEEFPAPAELLGQVRDMGREQRRAHVVAAQRSLAARSQRSVRTLLAGEEGRGRVRGIRVLWGVNGLALEAAPDAIERLAARPEVRRVLLDRVPARADAADAGESLPGPDPNATVAPDVVALGAQRIWSELGYTGAGVIVAVIDTGVDRTHPDLADHIWSNPGEIAANGLDDDGNGHVDDTWGWDFCADSQPVSATHGTQVAGQVAGDGTNGTVTGMAPDATLMALGIDCDQPSRSWLASDYAIAEGAHLITQSYSWWWTDRPDYEGFRRQADVELAAGLIHAQSAGNNGGSFTDYPIPYNISTPANCPPPWLHPDQELTGGPSSVVAVGNVTWGSDVIAASSSVGPSAWEDIQANTDPTYPYNNPPEYRDYPYENGARMGLIKPDLTAYGNGTNSTCPGGYYCQFSGTSSATPHVSGALALMLQSNPEATPEDLARALMTTAQHRGDPGKNNVYGAGLLQAHAAVLAVESGVVYAAHAIDDADHGNGDLALDPGETAVMQITVESRSDEPIEGLEVILTSPTPGVTIHDRHTRYSALPARGSRATSAAPHFSLSIAPDACSAGITFDLELRYAGKVRHSRFGVQIGTDLPLSGLDFDFETAAGWTSDPGTSTRGRWVREDPVGVDAGSGPSNPEDDTSPPPGVMCWVTGSGGGTPSSNDVDGGSTYLLSPRFGAPEIHALSLTYDRWYYDESASGDSLKVEVSNDDGATWTLVEQRVTPTGGWKNYATDLLGLISPSAAMRLRYTATDGSADTVVEAAVDEVHISGRWIDCQAYTPPAARRPNPVGDTLRAAPAAGGHVLLTWNAPPVDGAHDAATLYRIERAAAPLGPFTEAGTATSTSWLDLDGLHTPESSFYRVTAENSGGQE